MIYSQRGNNWLSDLSFSGSSPLCSSFPYLGLAGLLSQVPSSSNVTFPLEIRAGLCIWFYSPVLYCADGVMNYCFSFFQSFPNFSIRYGYFLVIPMYCKYCR